MFCDEGGAGGAPLEMLDRAAADAYLSAPAERKGAVLTSLVESGSATFRV